MKSVEKTRKALTESIEKQTLLRITRRPKYADQIQGYLVAIGKKWALVAQTSDGGYFDGYIAFRVADVTGILKDVSVAKVFARTQPEWPPSISFPIDLDTTESVTRALAQNAPLVGIEKENERRGLWIGAIHRFERKWVQIWEVRPDASWHKRALWYKLKAVTTVSTGTHYMNALWAVAAKAVPKKLKATE